MDETKKLEEVVGMRFASQEFFERLKNGLQDEKLKDWTSPNRSAVCVADFPPCFFSQMM